MARESYEELIYSLGDAAYERFWNRPDAPRGTERVLKAAEAYEQRQIELAEIEEAMDAEEAAYNEFCQACEQEFEECRPVIERYKKAVAIAEAKAKSLESKLISKRKDVAAARKALAKLEEQIRQWEADGMLDKAAGARAGIKRAKLDVMKRSRECDEMQAEYDKVMNPETGPGAEGIRARRREIDLEQQLEERTNAYNERIGELNEDAAAKDREVRAAQQYYEQAIMLLGEEAYRARIPDPALVVFYPRLDKLAK
ncbi:MAG: hypothetical protein ACOX6T_01405 [Myxococcales bacterium]|jgi:chromosome segregation ATPase